MLLVLKGKLFCAARSVAEVFKCFTPWQFSCRRNDAVEGRPSAPLLSTVQLTNPAEAAEVCSREDSARHLGGERLSNGGARHTVIPAFRQGTDTRTSSSSLKVSIPAVAARAVLTHVHWCTFACQSNLHHKFCKHSESSLLCHTAHKKFV